MMEMQNPLYGDVIDAWYNKHRLRIMESTAYNYKMSIPLVKEYFQGLRVRDITPDMVYDFVQYIVKRASSKTSATNYFKILKMSLDFAVGRGYIHYSPADDVKFPKKIRVEVKPFQTSEVYALLECDAPQWVKDGIMIAFRTGMRPGEIYALKWTDINLDVGYISVQRSISKACSETKETKTPAGVRRVEIDSKLKAYLESMESRGISEYVFPAPPKGRHKYRVPWNIAHFIRSMCQEAGIPYRNFYALRHTHATMLFSLGVHPKIVQERLGHSSIKVTVDTYSHIVPGIQRLAVEELEKI